jgi:uncharacterized membrane protein
MTEPTLVTTPPKGRFIPELRSPWWAALLALSLMANLVVGGAAIGARMRGDGWQMGLMENRAQLLPRKFFAALPHDRRRALMDMFRAKKDQFMQSRQAADAVTLKFADLLEQPEFDQVKVKAVIDDFTSGSTSFATQGEVVILDIVAKLTPDERKKLAYDIRERAARRGK